MVTQRKKIVSIKDNKLGKHFFSSSMSNGVKFVDKGRSTSRHNKEKLC